MAEHASVDGFWLPADVEVSDVQERAFGPGRVPVRVPIFTPRLLREVLWILKRNQEALGRRPVGEILAAIGQAAQSLTQPDGRYYDQVVAILPELTGYSQRMIEIGLQRMGAGWSNDSLQGALKGEFGSLALLDGFEAKGPSGWQRAYGPRLAVHIFSGNIPGVAVTSLVRALCVKAASFGKTAAGEPYLSVCFARALADVDRELASCLAVGYWPGGSEDLETVAFSEAEAVVAYGSDAAMADIGCRVPAHVRFIPFPNRVGAGLLTRSALRGLGVARELARRAALDVVTFDQQGCVSPHTLYVERGGQVDPVQFGQLLAEALEALSREIPRGVISPAESTVIHQLRAQAEMRGATVLASEKGTGWTVILEERLEFEPSPLNRVIYVRPVGEVDSAIEALKPVGSRLQTITLAGATAELAALAERLGSLGATRIVPFGEGAWPAANWHHDGRFQFLDLVRFVDLRGPAEAHE